MYWLLRVFPHMKLEGQILRVYSSESAPQTSFCCLTAPLNGGNSPHPPPQVSHHSHPSSPAKTPHWQDDSRRRFDSALSTPCSFIPGLFYKPFTPTAAFSCYNSLGGEPLTQRTTDSFPISSVSFNPCRDWSVMDERGRFFPLFR